MTVFDSGGYAYLHRDVPLFFASYTAVHHLPGTSVPFRTVIVFHDRPLEQYPGPAMASNTMKFNYLIASPGDAYPAFDPVACFTKHGNVRTRWTCVPLSPPRPLWVTGCIDRRSVAGHSGRVSPVV